MSELFNVKYLGVLTSIAILLIIINLSTGTVIVSATGILASGGFVMLFIWSIFNVLTKMIINISGSVTLMCFIGSFLSLLAPILGPPGFLPKIIIWLIVGFLVDIIFKILKKHCLLASIISGIVISYVSIILIIIIFKLFLPLKIFQSFMKIAPYYFYFNLLEGGLGGYCGWLIYNRIKDATIVKNIQAK